MAETKWHAPSTKVLSTYKDRALQKDSCGKDSPNKFSHVSSSTQGFPQTRVFFTFLMQRAGYKLKKIADHGWIFVECVCIVIIFPYSYGKYNM